MILKIPIYLETEEKFTPDQVQEMNLSVQYLMTKEIHQITDGNLTYRLFGNKQFKFKLLSSEQVRNRITGPGKQTNP